MTEATVERIRLFLIESPIKMARLQGVGNVKGTVKRVLIELTSSDGVIGWGEAAPWEVFTGTPEAAFSALDIYLRPIVLGKPARRIRALMAELDRALIGHAEAKVAIEMALLDIVGKSSGLSVADLLGGAGAVRRHQDLARGRAVCADLHRATGATQISRCHGATHRRA